MGNAESNPARDTKFSFISETQKNSQKLPVICLYLSIIGTGAVYYQSRVDGVSHPLFIEQTADVSVVSFYSQ